MAALSPRRDRSFSEGKEGSSSSSTPSVAQIVYFRGRGLAELPRWLLAAAHIPFVNVCLDTPEELELLRSAGDLMFNQLPLLRIDGLRIVQSNAQTMYIARKAGLLGSDPASEVRTLQLLFGIRDADEPLGGWVFAADREAYVRDKIAPRVAKFYPHLEREATANERRNGHQPYLVGSSLSAADVALGMTVYHLVEYTGSEAALKEYPAIARIARNVWQLPSVAAFLSGPQHYGKPDEAYVKNVNTVLGPLRPKLHGVAHGVGVRLIARLLNVAGISYVWEDETTAFVNTHAVPDEPVSVPRTSSRARVEGWEVRLVHDGATVEGTAAVAEYVAELVGDSIWPAARASRSVARSLLQAAIQVLGVDTPADGDGPTAGASQHPGLVSPAASRLLHNVETTLATSSGPYLFGSSVTVADIGVYAVVEMLELAHCGSAIPAPVRAWFEVLRSVLPDSTLPKPLQPVV